jgi:hypothetical protein
MGDRWWVGERCNSSRVWCGTKLGPWGDGTLVGGFWFWESRKKARLGGSLVSGGWWVVVLGGWWFRTADGGRWTVDGGRFWLTWGRMRTDRQTLQGRMGLVTCGVSGVCRCCCCCFGDVYRMCIGCGRLADRYTNPEMQPGYTKEECMKRRPPDGSFVFFILLDKKETWYRMHDLSTSWKMGKWAWHQPILGKGGHDTNPFWERVLWSGERIGSAKQVKQISTPAWHRTNPRTKAEPQQIVAQGYSHAYSTPFHT